MVFCFILGAACAVATYFGASRLGTYLIDRYYLDETATLQREQALLESFDDYVQAGNLTSEDSEAIGAWAEDMKYAYILIFRGGVLTMEADATASRSPWRTRTSGMTIKWPMTGIFTRCIFRTASAP